MGVGLYIHIPFCKSKCMYCDFCSFSGKENMMIDYTHALCKEILLAGKGKNIETVFIGGGTPTYLCLEAWELIGNCLKELNISDKAEFTVECNPGTIDIDKLKMLKKLGVNRISIGLQAWQDNLLKSIGRIHTRDEFIDCFNMVRSQGIDNINVDIMFGLPDQRLSDLKETVEELSKLNPEHISCYSLIVEENTPFGKLYEKGRLKLPDEDLEREMYDEAVKLLEQKGYKQYEISNFSKDGFQCKHNIKYWKTEEYVACGLAAHGYVDGIRYRNEENIKKYIRTVNELGLSVVESYKNTKEDDIEEFMFMGLRMLEGVSEDEFYNRFGLSLWDLYGEVITKFIKINYLEYKDRHISINPKALGISNSIMCEFILDKN
ncbi:Oxygen-independent coproporphyrinogen-III oxidase 1 [Clostridium sp. N3C]|uniref:radical SAM family heme chaperone HemW n=1 Tax=Clostridium sp. N3C TaxID=1776758 RepID=UPI00092E0A57|nr:radical SAM family heme chaperone HemW [Clostridium sp. N3C]SCN21762.1 Oxygen-independent coproporphyrinogen-III oxidase 1 [Clostridium sp. N3C]